MDTSKEYIEMCEKAEEIQAGCRRSLPIENLFYFPDLRNCIQYDSEYMKEKDFYRKRIWLPRQDQLQEMTGLDFIDCVIAINEFSKSCYRKFTSMEQLWLAFVMYEKFKKVWNGSEWRKEE